MPREGVVASAHLWECTNRERLEETFDSGMDVADV